MKNIHVLPTDKPSRIIKGQDNVFILLDTYAPNWFGMNLKTTKQNIYITSDEEIKEGDWYLTNKNTLCKCIKTDSKYVYSLEGGSNTNCEKIILTTDQDLIKDGVQDIDDEFLEWFVKNPSCESVEVKNPLIANVSDFGYKIIIPKEDFCDNCNNDVCCCIIRVQPKQETLEEKLDKIVSKEPSKFLEESDKRTKTNEELYNACTEYSNKHYSTEKGHPEEDWYISWLAFNNGAKWQQERMYSEEIVDILDNVRYWETCPNSYKVIIERFIEQFRNK